MDSGYTGISILILILVFAVLWIWTGKQKRAHEQRQRKLRQNRKAQLAKLKAEKRREEDAAKQASLDEAGKGI